MSNKTTTYEYCDGDALPAESTDLSSLEPDQVYKICPGKHTMSNGTNAPLGQPRCGDGSNYSFLVLRPEKQQPQEKVYIELSGGGACWDSFTCSAMSYQLSVPPWLTSLVGSSCSAMAGILCGKTLGDTDFSTYTRVLVPYCTQDIHLGDSPNITYGGSRAFYHVGAHNLYRTLQWVFDNFPNPSHMFLTGCSAGGTPLPIVYDLINTHYNSGAEKPSVSVIADSPVFLTPSNFLQNFFPNWNVGTIMKMTGFDFDTYMNEESLPLEMLDYALGRSDKDDNWGFVTHRNDQTSLIYYSLMAGSFGGGRELLALEHGDIGKFNRRAEDLQSEWWDQLNNTMTVATNEYGNFDMFVMDGNGHCNFGLNTPLQYEGFEEWASNIVRETDVAITTDSPSASPTNSSLSPTWSPSNATNMSDFTATASDVAMTQVYPSYVTVAVVMLAYRFLISHV